MSVSGLNVDTEAAFHEAAFSQHKSTMKAPPTNLCTSSELRMTGQKCAALVHFHL
jgi:hypothetical protein